MGQTDQKVMLITGASSGIGAETAKQAAAAGYKLVLAARDQEKLIKRVAELGGEDEALPVATDVAEWDEMQELVKATMDKFGRIDAVFANAGFGAKRGFLEDTPEKWRSMVLTNVYGVALTIRATLPVMLEAGSGHFLITGSVAGRRALPGSLYSATKWAVSAIGESLRQELRRMHENHSIRVTLIEPGMTDTPFFDSKPELRALEPADIARAVIFALEQPEHVDVNEILIRPTAQPN
jgi:NADP-dependent 3-hydroxy acid dehydrogenase YdfG